MSLLSKLFGRTETLEKTETLIHKQQQEGVSIDLTDSLKAESHNLLTPEEEQEYNMLRLEKDTTWLSLDKEPRFLYLRLKFFWKTQAQIYTRIFEDIRQQEEEKSKDAWIPMKSSLTSEEQNEFTALQDNEQKFTESEIDRYFFLAFRELGCDERTSYNKSVQLYMNINTPQYTPEELEFEPA